LLILRKIGNDQKIRLHHERIFNASRGKRGWNNGLREEFKTRDEFTGHKGRDLSEVGGRLFQSNQTMNRKMVPTRVISAHPDCRFYEIGIATGYDTVGESIREKSAIAET